MTTISIPLAKDLLVFIDNQIKAGIAEIRSQAVRQALRKMSEDQEMKDISDALLDVKEERLTLLEQRAKEKGLI